MTLGDARKLEITGADLAAALTVTVRALVVVPEELVAVRT